ncbi:MAG: hypothetical protein ACMV1D_11405 [Macromonas sp.]
MIHDPQHTILALTVRGYPHLLLTFADGVTLPLDLSSTIQKYPALGALADSRLFAKAHLDARGGYVVWLEDELEMAADNLRHLATEQAGDMGHERLWVWMHRNHLTQERAAQAIGVSRRMLNYYLSGAKPIPKTVWLACLGWEMTGGMQVA